MVQIRKALDRGYADHGWLKSFHTFSFADYRDPAHMGFSVLRVINEDRIQGGMGFDTHGHRDMEIVSYIISGAVEHKDSMGNVSVIKPGEVQRMSAGTGVMHSEYNHLSDKEAHFLQIWIFPKAKALRPSDEQISFEEQLRTENLILVASENGQNSSVTLNQDAKIFACRSSQKSGTHCFRNLTNRKIWVQTITGKVCLKDPTGVQYLTTGDGAALENISDLEMSWEPGSHFLVFDLPG